MALGGCASQTESHPTSTASPKPIDQDIKLTTDFLEALLRPERSKYRVIVDADSEESMRHIPLAIRNKQLQGRLAMLRTPPRRLITVNVHSADIPKPWGSGYYIYAYDTGSGDLAERGSHEIGGDQSDMWIRIDHWPSGTRLVSLSFTWIDDTKNDIFHLRQGENTFRFAIASEPLID